MTDPAATRGSAPAPTDAPPASFGSGPPPGGPPPGPAADRSGPAARPAPQVSSLAGAAGGVLLLFSLFLLLGEIGGDNRRLGGIVLSLLFEAVGVGLLLLHRDPRRATAGVTLTAIGVVPLLIYLFVDVRNPGRTIDDVGSFTTTATLVLLTAAGLWLAAYLFGPGRYGLYLGAALLALWLVAVVQIVDEPLGQVVDGFGSSATFNPVTVEGLETFDPDEPASEFGSDDFGTEFGSDDFGTDDLDAFEEEFSDDFSDDFSGGFSDEFSDDFGSSGEGFVSPDDPSTDLGVVSLLFGGAYLAAAWARDRRQDHRQATVLVAVAIPILTLAVPFLAGDLEGTGAALLGLTLGATAAWVGTRSGRRFTSWYGTGAAVVAVTYLVEDAVGESLRVSALVLAVIGLALALAAMGPGRFGRPGSRAEPGATGPAAGWTAPAGAAPWGAPTAPTGPPDDRWAGPPGAASPGTAPPAWTPPGGSPWPAGPPAPDAPAPWTPGPGAGAAPGTPPTAPGPAGPDDGPAPWRPPSG